MDIFTFLIPCVPIVVLVGILGYIVKSSIDSDREYSIDQKVRSAENAAYNRGYEKGTLDGYQQGKEVGLQEAVDCISCLQKRIKPDEKDSK